MEERRRPWAVYVFLLTLIGHLQLPCVLCQADYFDEQLKGDNEGGFSEPLGNSNLGFDDVVRRHDGYVKGEAATIPKTSFTCSGQPHNPGLYADMEANCQVYHVCFEDRQESFLCGPGTNFNQRILACDFWYNFNCADSASFYSANSEIGKVPDTIYRPDQSAPDNRRTERPSYPSFPQQGQEEVPTGDYVPPRINVPPPPQPRPRPPIHVTQPSPPPRQPPPPRQLPPRQPLPPPPPRVESQPPRIPQPSFQPPRVSYPTPRPLPPQIHQEVDSGYDVQSQHPVDVPPPRSEFPPVISPPRVIRPPVQHPVVIRRPEEPSYPRTPTHHEQRPIHPDAEIKGSDYVPPRPQPPRIPQPSQPIDVEYPPRQPRPPTVIQQEHVDVDHIPPPPRRPIQRPPPVYPPIQQEVVHPPPPPRPIQQEVIVHDPIPPPPPRQPQPSVIVSQQQRPSPPPARPQVVITPRPRQPARRPPPVFPPSIDHPNANVKGGPGYRPPPPTAQLPSYDPIRINHRPSGSTTQTGYQPPPPPPVVIQRPPPPRPQKVRPPPPAINTDYKPSITIKQPAQSVSGPGYVRPLPPPRTPSTAIAVRPPPIHDHPDAGIKGSGYGRPPVRIISPATSISTVKRPQVIVDPVRPPPRILTVKTVKSAIPSTEYEVYQPPRPQTPTRPRIPQPIDHPHSGIKGGYEYPVPRPEPNLPVIIAPPPAPSTSIHRKIPSRGRDYHPQTPPQKPYYPKDDGYQQQQEVFEPEFQPIPPISPSVKDPISIGVKDSSSKRPSSTHQTIHVKPSQNEYDSGSNYKRGQENYPKPEFQKQTRPVAIPSRSSQTTRHGSASQPRASQQPGGRRPGGQFEYPFNQVPGHQPPHQPQVFPHRDNPDHPNESIKGTNAYRPPPPANFQSAASEVKEQIVEAEAAKEPEQKPESSKHGDTGLE